jgi:hypothetical protein
MAPVNSTIVLEKKERIRDKPECVTAGLEKAIEIIQSANGFYFGGELFPFALEFRSLALASLTLVLEERRAHEAHPNAA